MGQAEATDPATNAPTPPTPPTPPSAVYGEDPASPEFAERYVAQVEALLGALAAG
ncbi:hypothetical protein [Nonomuraea dietziae]|uniref:hypothetical protein n=1 Tax=Nonomuraea dietziae TaxID=65515 RepID=UPI0033E7E472